MTKPHNLCLRLLGLVLSLVCLLLPLCSAGTVFAQEAEEQEAGNATATCVVRNGTSRRSSVIGQMEDGTCITVLDEYSNHYKIDCYDMTGYIAKSQVEQRDGKYYVNCNGESSDVRSMTYMPHAEALAMRHSLMELAQDQLGYPYVYGGTRPGGFDCSGLMLYLYKNHGISLYRRASDQLSQGIIVPREGMQVGDLVFFREPGEYCPVSHVGIYVGNNQVIHASTSHGIEVATLEGEYFGDYFLCARRLVNVETAEVQELPAVNMERSVMTISSMSRRRAG